MTLGEDIATYILIYMGNNILKNFCRQRKVDFNMLIMSTKITKRKIIAFAVVCACLALILIISIPSGDTAVAKQAKTTLKTNEERIDYLASYGWTVSSEPVETVEIVIPSTFDETYENYNVLQKTQGFDLSAFKGKKVIRYTYEITNYPTQHEDPIHANLLMIDTKLIGGDVTSVSLGGFMHSFEMPNKNTVTDPTDGSLENTDYDLPSNKESAGKTTEEILDQIFNNTSK